MEARYNNPDNDPRGPWKPGGLDARNYYSKGIYPITTPSGNTVTLAMKAAVSAGPARRFLVGDPASRVIDSGKPRH